MRMLVFKLPQDFVLFLLLQTNITTLSNCDCNPKKLFASTQNCCIDAKHVATTWGHQAAASCHQPGSVGATPPLRQLNPAGAEAFQDGREVGNPQVGSGCAGRHASLERGGWVWDSAIKPNPKLQSRSLLRSTPSVHGQI